MGGMGRGCSFWVLFLGEKSGCACSQYSPFPENVLIFELKMVSYGAFWVLFLGERSGGVNRMLQWLEVRGLGRPSLYLAIFEK